MMKTHFNRYYVDIKSADGVFRAARTGNMASVKNLCDPAGEHDGDGEDICHCPESRKQKFMSYFAEARGTGPTRYSKQDGVDIARVPFWFNHPAGPSRSQETMVLVERQGKWYLLSF